MVIKLDINKAYNRVEWGFIEKAIVRIGFHEKWISLIMHYISIVTYFVLTNGVANGCIIPTRGLRQGDPLSSYLFLLYANGISSLINEVARNKLINGISICRGCPTITYLFFADDSLLFCEASKQECQKLIEILDLYEAASGQKINTDESSIFFSHNTSSEKRSEMLEILGPM